MTHCNEQMAAVVKSVCMEYMRRNGEVPEDFFAIAGGTLADLCHPAVVMVGTKDWQPEEIAKLRDFLDAAKPDWPTAMESTADVIDQMGKLLFRAEWRERAGATT